ncbi:hypothetical protein D3C85_1242410 [compost metagenome]
MTYIVPMLGKSRGLNMTGTTGNGIIPGQSGLIKQRPSQLKALFCHLIIGEIINGLRKIYWLLKTQKLRHLPNHRMVFEHHILLTGQNKNTYKKQGYPMFFIHGD